MSLSLNELDQMRIAAEGSLFLFARFILGLTFFTEQFHKSLAEFLHEPRYYRKLALAPRDHAKTMMIKAQILHALIQPKNNNIYFPGVAGNELRIVLAGESLENASRHIRVIRIYIEKNPLLRTLWPHLQPGDKWADHHLVLRRTTNYSEPTLEAVGIETALASRHIDWLFEDDIFTYKAMLSPTLAQRTITWHQASEGVLDEHENARSRETVTGTPWAQNDVYIHIIENESSEASDLIDADEELKNDPNLFRVFRRSAIENNKPIWPERFSLARLRRIERRLQGTGLFELNFLCDYQASSLNEFQRSWLRYFSISDDTILLSSPALEPPFAPAGKASPLAQAVAEQMGTVAPLWAQTPTRSTEIHGTNTDDINKWLREVMR